MRMFGNNKLDYVWIRMITFIYRSCLRDGCYTTEHKSKQGQVVIACQCYVIGVRQYRVKSSPLQVFCNQLVDKISVSKTLNILVASFFFWVVQLRPGSVFLTSYLQWVGSGWCGVLFIPSRSLGDHVKPWGLCLSSDW